MNRRNLLPIDRQNANRRRIAVRRWVTVNGLYAVLLTIAGVAYIYVRPAAAAATLTPSTADADQLNSKLVVLRQQSALLNVRLRSVTEVTDRPDWSYLLAAVARSLDDRVVLTSLTGTPRSEAVAAADATPHQFAITGVGLSQAAVTQFVLRIESLRLFAKVNLAQTATQPARGVDGVGFKLICVLPEGDR